MSNTVPSSWPSQVLQHLSPRRLTTSSHHVVSPRRLTTSSQGVVGSGFDLHMISIITENTPAGQPIDLATTFAAPQVVTGQRRTRNPQSAASVLGAPIPFESEFILTHSSCCDGLRGLQAIVSSAVGLATGVMIDRGLHKDSRSPIES